MYRGDRSSGVGPVAKFAFLLERHQQLPRTRTEAEALARKVHTWLSKGKPMPEPETPAAPVVLTGRDLFDRWLAERRPFDPIGKTAKQVSDWESKLRRGRAAFDDVPLAALATTQPIRAWVAEEVKTHKLGTANRILASVVRPAVLWGQAQQPPLITGAPFGKYGYKIDSGQEGRRLGRIAPALEADLLAVCAELGAAGAVLADYLVLGIDMGWRNESLKLEVQDVDWAAHRVVLRRTKRAGEARYVPFNPTGRVAAILQRRRFAGPQAPVLARPDGSRVTTIWKTWVEAVCRLRGIPYACGPHGVDRATIAAYKALQLVPYLTRHEAATWWGLRGVSDASAKFLQGHSSQYDMHGRYKHEAYAIARAELAEKVWPCEAERAQPEAPAAAAVGA